MKKALLLFAGIFLLSACGGPKEEDFKSTVPLTDQTQVMTDQEAAELPLPEAVNYDVPFFSQAPDEDWSEPWQETCEEASIALAYHYFAGTDLTKEQFRKELLDMVGWQNENFGDYEDTTILETALLMKEYYGHEAIKVINNPILRQLKRELAKGHLIVVPLAGKMLENPFYSGDGPEYHMLVIKGYDAQHFITNDVGTKRGQNFSYPYDTIMNAIHDWNDGNDIRNGKKAVLVVM